MKQVAALSLGLAVFAAASSARAQSEQPPRLQWNASLALGLARYGDDDDLWQATRFAASARTEFFFGRTSNKSFGFGPTGFVGLSTYAEANLGAGLQLLVPVHEFFPLVVGAGIYGANREEQKARPGAYLSLGWGARSFNYHSPYSLAGGLLFEARRDFSEAPVTTWLASVQLDAAALTLPVVWAINVFR